MINRAEKAVRGLKTSAVFQVAAILSSIFISQSISVYMEMLQRRADQRKSHVFSTAGRSEVLPTNSVPEGPQRPVPVCCCGFVFCFSIHMYAHVSGCNDGEGWS